MGERLVVPGKSDRLPLLPRGGRMGGRSAPLFHLTFYALFNRIPAAWEARCEMMERNRRKPRKINWKVKLILLGSSLLICLVALEIAVRVSGVNDQFTRKIFSKNLLQVSELPVLVYEPKPGGFSKIDGVENRISSQGLRDREFAIPKPDGTFRIIALGDSVTFGLGVRAEETFSKYLEQMINDKREQGQKTVEVLNMGVNGYKTVQEVEYLRVNGLRFEPDLVILEYNLNDPGDFSRELSYFRHWQNKRWTDESMSFGERFRARLTQFSDLAFMIKYRTVKFQLGGILKGSEVTKDKPRNYDGYFHLYQNKPVMQALHEAFDKLAAMGSKNQFQVILAVFPILREFDDYRWTPLQHQVMEMGGNRGFFTLDVLDVFKAENKTGESLRRRHDDLEHPNPEGHEIAARAMYGLIKENDLLSLD